MGKIVKTSTGYNAKNEQPEACKMVVPSKGKGAPDYKGHRTSGPLPFPKV